MTSAVSSNGPSGGSVSENHHVETRIHLSLAGIQRRECFHELIKVPLGALGKWVYRLEAGSGRDLAIL